jgi:hypothetical protein
MPNNIKKRMGATIANSTMACARLPDVFRLRKKSFFMNSLPCSFYSSVMKLKKPIRDSGPVSLLLAGGYALTGCATKFRLRVHASQ